MIKKLAIALVALLALGGTVSAFAWWDTLQETQNETLTVGEGTDLVVDVVAAAPAGKVLVPAGVVLKANDVESITLTYNVYLDQTAVEDLDLSVVASNVLIGGSNTYANLVNVNVSTASNQVNNGAVLTTVVVTLTEPADQAAYNAVINQDITFDLTFSATQSN